MLFGFQNMHRMGIPFLAGRDDHRGYALELRGCTAAGSQPQSSLIVLTYGASDYCYCSASSHRGYSQSEICGFFVLLFPVIHT